jgi:hypothetical protein
VKIGKDDLWVLPPAFAAGILGTVVFSAMGSFTFSWGTMVTMFFVIFVGFALYLLFQAGELSN